MSSPPSSFVTGKYLSERSKLSFSLFNHADSSVTRTYVGRITKETKTTRRRLEIVSGIREAADLNVTLGTPFYQMNAWMRGAEENPAVERLLLKWAINADPRPELRNAQGEIPRKGGKQKSKHHKLSSSSSSAAAPAAVEKPRKKKQRVLLSTVVYASEEEEEEQKYADNDVGELRMPSNVIEPCAMWPAGTEPNWFL